MGIGWGQIMERDEFKKLIKKVWKYYVSGFWNCQELWQEPRSKLSLEHINVKYVRNNNLKTLKLLSPYPAILTGN